MNLKNFVAIVFTTLLFTEIYSAQTLDSLYEVGTWQEFKSGAVSFTFDDNCPNQLSVVMPMFDKYGFKMTFFTVINWGPNWTALQAAASNGHEVASHTLSHASLGSLTDDQQITELKNSQDVINSHIEGQKCLTIAYPNCVLGNSSICKQYYVAARGCSGVVESKTPHDFMNISSIVCGSQGSVQRTNDFTNKANAAASSNGWVVFLLHAIDGEPGYSPTSSAELKGALDYLSQNENKFWVSTFGNVARYIKERNNVSVKQVSEEDTLIKVSMTDTLDDSIYNLPVTIRRVLPQGWTSARATQSGKILNSQIVNANSKSCIMFDAVPNSGEVMLIKEKVTGAMGSNNREICNPFLMQNYPNPFNPVTTINYQVAENSLVSLKVYDIIGREISTLVDKHLSPGKYSVRFDGSNLSSGLYFCKLSMGNYTNTKKLVLLK